LGEEVAGGIFDRGKGKAKRDESASEGASNRPGKKKKKWNNRGSLIASADHKGGMASARETPDHFEKMPEKPCPSTKPRAKEMVPRTFPFKDASAPTATRTSLSTLASVGTRMSKWRRTKGITLAASPNH
jgi:hypothetical protein